ncbi:MAG: hypothetical protein E7415_04985 [Ruminococcaceae bacterium]|nr:hypothetical protein [Oscillospiraceae bacterium]
MFVIELYFRIERRVIMNCFYHGDRAATVTCQSCGRGLCTECASITDTPVCKDCIQDYVRSEKAEMLKTIVIGLIIGIALSVFIGDIKGLCFGWVPFGWKSLNAVTPQVFLFLPLVGWVIYFIIKFVIAFFIGWVALPIKIYKWINLFRNANNVLG